MTGGKQEEIIREVRERLRRARRVFVLTGAGVSAESGVPTFRGGGGAAVWKGMPFDVISSAEMVEQNLAAVWEWFDFRREKVASVRPNPAHFTLSRWQDRFAGFTLATQNVDGLHTEAGSREVLELHGSIWRARCTRCGAREDLRGSAARPTACGACGAPLRPDVVLFGELLPSDVWQAAADAAAACDFCLVVGTSALVYPAAGLPLEARRAGAYLVEVNPEATPLSDSCDAAIQGPAGEILPALEEAGEGTGPNE